MKKDFDLQTKFSPAGDQPHAIKQLTQNCLDGLSHQTLLGVTGSGKTFTMAHVIENLGRPTMILAPNKTLAAQLYSEMRDFFPNNAIEYFVSYYDYYQPEAYVPASDTYIEKDSAINDQIEQMRLSATKALMERSDAIIVATVSAIYGLGDPKSYLNMVLHLSCGGQISQRNILNQLTAMQYQRNDIAFQRSTFRVRGDVIDVYPADSGKEAVRIELFDEEVERLSEFDPLTGEVLRTIRRLTIYPKTHFVTPREKILVAIDTIKDELKQRLAVLRDANLLVEAQRLEQRTLYDIEMMLELGYCSGIENYSRHLTQLPAGSPPPTLFDYLPDNALLMIDESHVTVPQLGAMYLGDRARKETLVKYGFRLPSALDNRPLRFDEFAVRAPQIILVSATPSKYEQEKSQAIVEQLVRPTGLIDPEIEIRAVATQVDDVMSEITKRTNVNERVLITTLTKRMAEDLSDYLENHGIKVRYLHSDIGTVERVEIIRDLRLGVFDVLVGINLLREGLDMPEVSLVAIMDADKEGFLRSERSLIQTIGRAARHLNGKAILYADRVTGAMERAIFETTRRRKKQHQYNIDHNITPKSIEKNIANILEESGEEKSLRKVGKLTKEQAINKKYVHFEKKELLQQIKKLEKKMLHYATDLEFEAAANIRDEIDIIKKLLLNY